MPRTGDLLVINRRQFLKSSTAFSLMSFLPAFALKANTLPRYDGEWQTLFNGQDLKGWKIFDEQSGLSNTSKLVKVQNGIIHILAPETYSDTTSPFGYIATENAYSNYHLSLEFKFGTTRYDPRRLAKRNNGVLYHLDPNVNKIWPNGVEFQLQESDMGDAILINAQCWPGADLGGTPAWPNQVPITPKPADSILPEPRRDIERQRVVKNGNFEREFEWNKIEIIAINDKVAHLVNGRIINTLFDIRVQRSDNRNAFTPLTNGRIALEIEAAEAMFRNIQIRQIAN